VFLAESKNGSKLNEFGRIKSNNGKGLKRLRFVILLDIYNCFNRGQNSQTPIEIALTEVKLNYMCDCYIHNYVLCPVKMHFYRSLATVKIINCDCDNQPSSLSLYARCLNINTLQNMDWNQISTDCLI